MLGNLKLILDIIESNITLFVVLGPIQRARYQCPPYTFLNTHNSIDSLRMNQFHMLETWKKKRFKLTMFFVMLPTIENI